MQAEDQQSDFVQGLRKALLTSGAKLAESASDASGTVRIVTDEVKQNRALRFRAQHSRASTS